MPGRSPYGAYLRFKDPLQQAFSTIAVGQVISNPPGKRNLDEVRTLYLGPKDRYVSLKRVESSNSDHNLKFKGEIYYQIIRTKRSGNGRYRATTRGYKYSVKTSDDEDVFDYHWHPEGESSYADPHMHLGSVQVDQEEVAAKCKHWPSGRVTFEGIIRQLITEFGVQYLCDDWEEKLARSEDPHLEHRSWGGNKRWAGRRSK